MIDLYESLAADSKLMRRVTALNRALTIVGYVAYPVLLALLAAFKPSLLASRIAVPASAFVVVSVARRLINAPRPYEGPNARPALIDKGTSGRSFPSRHTFSMFMIAFAWISWIPFGVVPGCVLAACACALGAARVALGVHHLRDVVAASIAALMLSLVGYPLTLIV